MSPVLPVHLPLSPPMASNAYMTTKTPTMKKAALVVSCASAPSTGTRHGMTSSAKRDGKEGVHLPSCADHWKKGWLKRTMKRKKHILFASHGKSSARWISNLIMPTISFSPPLNLKSLCPCRPQPRYHTTRWAVTPPCPAWRQSRWRQRL